MILSNVINQIILPTSHTQKNKCNVGQDCCSNACSNFRCIELMTTTVKPDLDNRNNFVQQQPATNYCRNVNQAVSLKGRNPTLSLIACHQFHSIIALSVKKNQQPTFKTVARSIISQTKKKDFSAEWRLFCPFLWSNKYSVFHEQKIKICRIIIILHLTPHLVCCSCHHQIAFPIFTNC